MSDRVATHAEYWLLGPFSGGVEAGAERGRVVAGGAEGRQVRTSRLGLIDGRPSGSRGANARAALLQASSSCTSSARALGRHSLEAAGGGTRGCVISDVDRAGRVETRVSQLRGLDCLVKRGGDQPRMHEVGRA